MNRKKGIRILIKHNASFQSRFLQTCNIPLYDFKIEPFTLVAFGGAGDFKKGKILYLLDTPADSLL
ncbi:MAG: hypothetical protein ACMUIM_03125 [bacterium]